MVKKIIALLCLVILTTNLQAQDDVKTLTTRERIYLGGGINGFSIGDPTSIGVSPSIGYLATNSTVLGVSLTYQYYKFSNLSSSLFGKSLFIKQYLPVFDEKIGPLFLTGQVDSYSRLDDIITKYSTPILIGIGSGNRTGTNISVLYDVNYSSSATSPYGSAWVVQIGGLYF
jgi:hypothetical protein